MDRLNKISCLVTGISFMFMPFLAIYTLFFDSTCKTLFSIDVIVFCIAIMLEILSERNDKFE